MSCSSCSCAQRQKNNKSIWCVIARTGKDWAAWRRSACTSTSAVEEAFADCDLPLPPGSPPFWGPLDPGLPQPLLTSPDLLTALAACLERLWPHNDLTLHTSWTVQEVIATQACLLESIHYEVVIYSPADWVLVLALRCSLKAEQLRQRTPPAFRPPLSLTVVQFEVMKSGAFLLAPGFARDFPLAPDITPSSLRFSAWFVTVDRKIPRNPCFPAEIPLGLQANRECVTQTMVETFNVPATHVATQAACVPFHCRRLFKTPQRNCATLV